MEDILVLAVLGKFFIEIRPSLDIWTFALGALGLAFAAGLGRAGLLRPWLSIAALLVWLFSEMQQRPGFAWVYVALVSCLVLVYLMGRLLKLSRWAVPAAFAVAVFGLSMLGSVVSRP